MFVQNDSETAITFQIKNFGFNVDGDFNDVTLTSSFNIDNLSESFMNAEIKVNSIFTNSKSRDEHLLKSDFFDVKKYPKIVFRSTEIVQKTNSIFMMKGSLMIKGIQKILEVPLEIIETKTSIRFLANFVINRKDFEVGGSSFVLSKNVNINMIYVAIKN